MQASPQNATLYMELGSVYEIMQNIEQSVVHYREVFPHTPSHPHSHLHLHPLIYIFSSCLSHSASLYLLGWSLKS